MAGSLTLTVGPLTAVRALSATNAALEAGVRNAAETWGYPGDAQNDAPQDVADWLVGRLVTYARDASRSRSIDAAVITAIEEASAAPNPFD